MGSHLRVLSESYPMNTYMTGFKWFSKKSLLPGSLDENSLGIRRVNFHQAVLMQYKSLSSDAKIVFLYASLSTEDQLEIPT